MKCTRCTAEERCGSHKGNNRGISRGAAWRYGLGSSWRGKSQPEEMRSKISDTLSGRALSEEHKENLRRPKSVVGRANIRKAQQEGSVRQKTSERSKENWHDSEYRQTTIDGMIGLVRSEKARANISAGKKQYYQNPKHRAEQTARVKQLWQDPEYAYKVLSANGIRPNKAEQVLLNLISPKFQYVGDGKLTVSGKVPDFWNGGTKLIEMYGDYWHRGDNPQDRINLFKEAGYDCIVIWERELKDPDSVVARVSDFMGVS